MRAVHGQGRLRTEIGRNLVRDVAFELHIGLTGLTNMHKSPATCWMFDRLGFTADYIQEHVGGLLTWVDNEEQYAHNFAAACGEVLRIIDRIRRYQAEHAGPAEDDAVEVVDVVEVVEVAEPPHPPCGRDFNDILDTTIGFMADIWEQHMGDLMEWTCEILSEYNKWTDRLRAALDAIAGIEEDKLRKIGLTEDILHDYTFVPIEASFITGSIGLYFNAILKVEEFSKTVCDTVHVAAETENETVKVARVTDLTAWDAGWCVPGGSDMGAAWAEHGAAWATRPQTERHDHFKPSREVLEVVEVGDD